MPTSHAKITTAAASRYLQQLCKHWSHKFAVEFTAERGHIPFDGERACTLEAGPDNLTLHVEASDEAALSRLEDVVIEHLKRFAFRENLGEVQWSRAG
jgi:hypothetical protein